MLKNRKKEEFIDDGRTIADMSSLSNGGYYEEVKKDKMPESKEQLYLDKEGKRALYFGVLKSSLLIGSVYAVAALLFILFCVLVWFK